jgi:ABC-type multidrug transport system fused ATPase/permease subunit
MKRIVRHAARILTIIRSVPGYHLIIGLQLASGITSFIGIPLLIPALKYINNRAVAEDQDFIQRWVESFFAFFNIPLTLNLLLITISILVIGGLLLDTFSSLLTYYIEYNMYARCSKRVFQGYLDVKWHWLVKHHSGQISHALYSETSQWSHTAFCALKILASLIQFATFFALAIDISLVSTVLVGIAFIVLMIINIFNAQVIKHYALRKNEEQKVFATFVNSTQQNKKFLKASLIHDSVINRFGQITDLLVVFAKRMARWQQLQKLWTHGLVFLLLVLTVAFHKKLFLNFEALAVLLLVFMRLMPQLNILAAEYSMFSQSLPVYDSVQKRLADFHKNNEVYGKYSYRDSSSIRLENVSFSYNSGSEILKKVFLNIPSRSTVAIVGGSGAGKSTILDLILGLWTPSSGRILYGNIMHEQLDYSTLRKRTAYVSQETTLFNGSLRENLTIGNQSASDAELNDICKMVFLDGLISELPDGLDSEIGENGIQLSGGQRQRLALGRAVLMEPDILILDEATSSLDLESEQVIQQAVNSLHQNLTIIIVAHRLSTVKNADLIYVLEEGEICESGNYEQLLRQKGRFSSLYSMQLAETVNEHSRKNL